MQFKFWQDVEVGWRYAVPLFVESWQYDGEWQEQLLEVIGAFQIRFDGDSKKRLRIFAKDLGYYSFDTDSRKALLDELEKLAKQKRGWFDGESKTERMLILSILRGRLYRQLENYSESLQIYLEAEKKLPETALHLQKDLAEEFSTIGNKFLWKEDEPIASTEAQTAYQSSVALNPENSRAWRGLGVSLEKLGLYESAIASFQQAIDLDPKYAHSHIYLGCVYSKQGKHELAIASCQQAINLDPKSAAPHLGLVYVYSNQGKYELAFASCQQAINLNPKSAAPHLGLVYVYSNQGKYELAFASCQQAIDLDPKSACLHSNLGYVYRSQGEYELAIASYQQAIDLDPKLANPHNGLGYVYRTQGEYELAIASYQQAINLDPKLAKPHNGLGYVYRTQGEYELAIASCQQAINLDPKFAYPKFNLGIVMGLQGNQEEAITFWKQGLELLTGNSQYERLFRALHEVGIGEIERGTNSLREILETEKPPLGDLSDLLEDAELIARFPTKLEGIDTVVELLRQAIEKAQ